MEIEKSAEIKTEQRLAEIIFENKENIPDGLYLELMNTLKLPFHKRKMKLTITHEHEAKITFSTNDMLRVIASIITPLLIADFIGRRFTRR